MTTLNPVEYTVEVSGVKSRLVRLRAALTEIGAAIDEQAVVPGTNDATVRVRHFDLNTVKETAEANGWCLKLHWETPVCQVCAGSAVSPEGGVCAHCEGRGVSNKPVPSFEEKLASTLESISARLDRLEGRSR